MIPFKGLSEFDLSGSGAQSCSAERDRHDGCAPDLPDTLAVAWRAMLLRYLPGARGRRLSTLSDWERDRTGAKAEAPEGMSVRQHKILDDSDAQELLARRERAKQRRAMRRNFVVTQS